MKGLVWCIEVIYFPNLLVFTGYILFAHSQLAISKKALFFIKKNNDARFFDYELLPLFDYELLLFNDYELLPLFHYELLPFFDYGLLADARDFVRANVSHALYTTKTR